MCMQISTAISLQMRHAYFQLELLWCVIYVHNYLDIWYHLNQEAFLPIMSYYDSLAASYQNEIMSSQIRRGKQV
jgi:hypothetical protein